ncbi:MAG: hypothetical protein V9H69_17090, partial [Anaerolineae bacterium]
DQRFQSAEQMRDALGGKAAFKSPALPARRRSLAVVWTGITLLLVALLAGGLLALNGRGAVIVCGRSQYGVAQSSHFKSGFRCSVGNVAGNSGRACCPAGIRRYDAGQRNGHAPAAFHRYSLGPGDGYSG